MTGDDQQARGRSASDPVSDDSWPVLSLPPAEAERLREAYAEARVILEYGAGGSTIMASGMPGKRVFSVESDPDWAIRLDGEIGRRDLPSPATVYHVDIGPTGLWGRPTGPERWMSFHRYPLAIWEEPFFRQPDVVLIDGRFRAACLMAAMLRTRRDITVLFDDYLDRPHYHGVERFLSPAEVVGRMAVFRVTPGMIGADDLVAAMAHFFTATYAGQPFPGGPPEGRLAVAPESERRE